MQFFAHLGFKVQCEKLTVSFIVVLIFDPYLLKQKRRNECQEATNPVKKTTAKEKEDLASSQDTESASQVPDTQAA